MSPIRGYTSGWHTRAATPGPPAAAPADAAVYPVDRGALAVLRHAVIACAADCGLDENSRDDLVLIANELATNVVRHGGGTGLMALWREGGRMVCRISDRGPGIADPDRAGVAGRAPDALTGRGLWLVRRLADGVEMASGRWGTAVTVSMPVRPA